MADLNITEPSFRPLISWPHKTKSVHARLTLPGKNEVSGSPTVLVHSKVCRFKLVN